MQEQADAYEDQFEELHNENHKIKNQNMFLETHMHEQRLEQERASRLVSSTFYYLGQIQVQKDHTKPTQMDWLDSQKEIAYAHDYEMILKNTD